MKRTLVITLFTVLAMVGLNTPSAHAMDYPHTDVGISTPINCGDCHFSHGDPPWKPSSPANIDDTFYNNQCQQCHTGSPGTDVKTHSSLQVDSSYGDFSIECWKCHDTHEHEQIDAYIPDVYIETGTVGQVLLDTPVSGESTIRDTGKNWTGEYDESTDPGTYKYFYILIPNVDEPYYTYKIKQSTGNDLVIDGSIVASKVTAGVSTYAIVYGRLVRSTIDAPDMSTCEVVANEFVCGSYTPRTVKYFNRTGPNSLGDGDATFDGVCEACHTKTSYNRNNDVGRAHNTGENCTLCHKHIEGFEINTSTMETGTECDTCHGFPPVDGATLVSNPGTTGSATAGAHSKHANTLGKGCGYCHVESAGYGATHNNGDLKVTMGFSLFAGSYEGGKYNGQSGVSYNATTTVPATDISNPDNTKTCSNIYCHSIVQSAGGGALTPDTSDYAAPPPVWDNPASVQCGSCHKSDGIQGDASLMDSGTHSKHVTTYTCDACHFGAGTGTNKHANGYIEVEYSSLNPSGTYSQSANLPGGGYGDCANLSCHGTGAAASPTWGGPAYKCSDCHFDTSDNDDYTFDNGTLATISSAEWSWSGHGRTTGSYDTSNNPAADFPGAAGSGDPCLYCHDSGISHGDGGNPFRLRNFDALGNGWNDVCLICHKTGQTTYDPDDVGPLSNKVATVSMNKYHDSPTYDTSPRDGGTLCFDCHDPHGDRSSGSGNIYMIQSSVTVNKADAYGTPGTTASPDFQDRSAGDGNDYAKEDPGNPGTYIGICQVCHYLTGNHRAGGGANQLHNLTNAPGCSQNGCHLHETNSTTDGLAFVQETSGDSCADCHSSAGGSSVGTTPDAGHANHVQNAYVGLLSTGDYGNYGTNTWYTFDNTGGTPDIGCGYCHPQDIASHANGSKDLNFDPNDRGADGTTKSLNKASGPWSSGSGNSVTCSGVYCHSTGYENPATGEYVYVDSPQWGTGSFTDIAEDRCAGCHGNSPNSTDSIAGLRVGSLSHYNTDYMGQGVLGGHFVGIHYDNVYSGTTGLEQNPAGTSNAHGDGTTSTTINCNTCHNATVTSTANDRNEVCITCHEGTTAALRGNMDIASGSTTHVNGSAEVVFENTTFNSKSQIRDDVGSLVDLPEINDNWTRNNSYKAGASSYDSSNAPLNGSSYSNGTCSSVACHNGYDVAWDDQKVDCLTCHKALLR